MAAGKHKPAAAGQKTPAAPQTARTPVARAAATPRGSNPQQLMREAAWSRMFGRIEAKNPFTR
jgi:hypothetical protein